MQAVALYGGQTLGPVGRWFVTQVAERQALGDPARSSERHFRERGNQRQGQPLPQPQDMLRDDLAGAPLPWVSWAVGDWLVKLGIGLCLLVPFRALLWKMAPARM